MPLHNIRELWLNNTTTSTLVPKNTSCGSTTCPGAAEKYIDAERFHEVQSKLKIQARDAVWWKDACLLYFQEFSGMPIPYEIERPIHELKDLQKVHLPISNYECPTKELLNKNR